MTTTPAGTVVGTERRGRVFVISMRRENKRNAVDAEMTALLDAAFNEFEDDADLWAAVLAGSLPAFCAGTDLRAGSGDPTPRGGAYGLIGRLRSKPVIAAVDGAALGGGFEVVLACDLVVASRAAVFGLPEAQRGTVAVYGGLFRGPRALPLNVLKELALTGRPLDASRAYALGLVNRLVEPGNALAGAVELAEEICACSPISVRESLRVIELCAALFDDVGRRSTEEARLAIVASADMREGIDAFLERRAPSWTGR